MFFIVCPQKPFVFAEENACNAFFFLMLIASSGRWKQTL